MSQLGDARMVSAIHQTGITQQARSELANVHQVVCAAVLINQTGNLGGGVKIGRNWVQPTGHRCKPQRSAVAIQTRGPALAERILLRVRRGNLVGQKA